MKFTLLPLFALAALFTLYSPASANPPPPVAPGAPPYHLTTVHWIINKSGDLDTDDRYVTLVGQVTGRRGDETFFFTDGTGSIRLDSENFELPIGPRLVIGGRIDQAYLGFGHLEVDVRNWHYARHP